MALLVAIDIGIKNLGICVYDFLKNQVVHWDNVSLLESGRYMPSKNVQLVHNFVRRYNAILSQAVHVIIERQMRCNMRIIEAIFESLFFDRCTVIAPKCVKMHYGISTRNYRSNKAKAVEWTRNFMTSNPDVFPAHVEVNFTKPAKRDDMADALLLVMYYLDTYSNQNNALECPRPAPDVTLS